MKKKSLEVLGALTGLVTSMPIWFYLLHWLLKQNSAGELQMFLFWIYVPVIIFITIILAIAKGLDDEV